MQNTKAPDEHDIPVFTPHRASFMPSWRWIAGVVLIMAVIVWPAWAVFYTDWLWFQDLGYQTVFVTRLTTKLTLALTTGLLVAAFVWLNCRLAQRNTQQLARGQNAAPRVINVNG
ncbi:MAG: UPF0182 family protein, partial [Blastocatellia bacterium]